MISVKSPAEAMAAYNEKKGEAHAYHLRVLRDFIISEFMKSYEPGKEKYRITLGYAAGAWQDLTRGDEELLTQAAGAAVLALLAKGWGVRLARYNVCSWWRRGSLTIIRDV